MAHMTSVSEGRLEQLAAECARQVALVARRLAMLLGRGRLERIGAVCGLTKGWVAEAEAEEVEKVKATASEPWYKTEWAPKRSMRTDSASKQRRLA